MVFLWFSHENQRVKPIVGSNIQRHDSTMAKADVGRRRATRGRWFVPPPTAEMTSTSAMERGMVGHGAMALIKKIYRCGGFLK